MVEPEGKLDADIQEIKDVPDFERVLSALFFNTDYFNMKFRWENKRVNPKRLDNPNYLRFAARIFAMAAEYNFEALTEFFDRHEDRRLKKSFSDPISLTATGCYLASITLQAQEQKQALIAELNERDGYDDKRDTEIRFCRIKPKDGKVYIPNYHKYKRWILNYRHLPFTRGDLPLLTPNVNFLQSVDQIGLSTKEADIITQDDFRKQYLSRTIAAFGPYCDVEDIFEYSSGVTHWASGTTL